MFRRLFRGQHRLFRLCGLGQFRREWLRGLTRGRRLLALSFSHRARRGFCWGGGWLHGFRNFFLSLLVWPLRHKQIRQMADRLGWRRGKHLPGQLLRIKDFDHQLQGQFDGFVHVRSRRRRQERAGHMNQEIQAADLHFSASQLAIEIFHLDENGLLGELTDTLRQLKRHRQNGGHLAKRQGQSQRTRWLRRNHRHILGLCFQIGRRGRSLFNLFFRSRGKIGRGFFLRGGRRCRLKNSRLFHRLNNGFRHWLLEGRLFHRGWRGRLDGAFCRKQIRHVVHPDR